MKTKFTLDHVRELKTQAEKIHREQAKSVARNPQWLEANGDAVWLARHLGEVLGHMEAQIIEHGVVEVESACKKHVWYIPAQTSEDSPIRVLQACANYNCIARRLVDVKPLRTTKLI